jgi:hypothetical protein
MQKELIVLIALSYSMHKSIPNVYMLDNEVYCEQPPGFVTLAHTRHVCRLHKSLYSLKQASWEWYQRFAHYAQCLGFVASQSDVSLFVMRHGDVIAYLLLYIDDIILTASTPQLCNMSCERERD